MTVRIPISIPRPELPTEECIPAWKNFWNSLCPEGQSILSNAQLYDHLQEWNAVMLRSQGVLEFETERAAVVWLLRWS